MACCYSDECGEFAVTPMLVAPYPSKCCEDEPVCFPCLPRCPKNIVYCCEKKSHRNRSRPYLGDRDGCCYHEHKECCRNPDDDCCHNQDYGYHRQKMARLPTHCRSAAPYCCPSDEPPCKPVKTKYVIPCYRYEDGRIKNQPTALMRRACEVAVGARVRRKPFVESSFTCDQTGQECRYHCEDERGNCCYHFERKKPCASTPCCETQTPCEYSLPCSNLHPCDPCLSCPPCRPCDSSSPSHPCEPCPTCQPCEPCHPCRPCQPCTSSPECQFVDCVQAKAVNPSKTSCFYV